MGSRGSDGGRRDCVVLYAGARGRIGGADFVNVVPLLVLVVVLFVRVGVFVVLTTRRDLDAGRVLFVGVVVVVFRACRMVDGDVSPKRNLDVSVACFRSLRRNRDGGRSGLTGGVGRRGSLTRDAGGGMALTGDARGRSALMGGGAGGRSAWRGDAGRGGSCSMANRAVRKRPPGLNRAIMRKGYD